MTVYEKDNWQSAHRFKAIYRWTYNQWTKIKQYSPKHGKWKWKYNLRYGYENESTIKGVLVKMRIQTRYSCETRMKNCIYITCITHKNQQIIS